MAAEGIKIEKLVQPVYYASHDVIEAVRTLILRTEELEEEILRGKLPEAEMSEAELKELDKALREMREEGKAITLEEFNQHQGRHQESGSKVPS
jgi:hypothetical protein